MGYPTENPLRADLDLVLAHTEPLWREFAGARLFITGGTGFFGTWLLESLAWANLRFDVGVRATILTRDPGAFARKAPHIAANPFLNFVTGDVRDSELPAGTFDAVIHGATDTDARRNAEDPLGMLETMHLGTRRVLERACSANARHVLLLSSGAVYGRQPPELERMPEDFPGSPMIDTPTSTALYGEGKRLMEMLAGDFHQRHGLPVVTARCFAFIGPHLPLDAHFAAGNFLRDACLGKEIVVQGDGRPFRSYLHAADLAIWLWTLLFRGHPGRAYNVGSDVPVSVAELAHLIASKAPIRPAVRILGAPGEALPERYVPDVSRARSELGLDIRIELPEAVDATFNWLKKYHARQTLP